MVAIFFAILRGSSTPCADDLNDAVCMILDADHVETSFGDRLCSLGYRVVRDQDLTGFPLVLLDDPEGQPSRKKVPVTGCYDWFHSGHVRFFEEVSGLGDLYVVEGNDANVRLLKGDGHPMFSQDERRYMVQSVRYVKQALISTGQGWMDAEPEIAMIKPDMYAVNEDGDQPEKREFCQAHGIQYVVLKRTPKEGLARF
jgi:cytidyltransferase-like protein